MNGKKTDEGKIYLSKDISAGNENEVIQEIISEIHELGMVPMGDIDPRNSDPYESHYNLSNDANIKLSEAEIAYCQRNKIKKTSKYLEEVQRTYDMMPNTQKEMTFEEFRVSSDWLTIIKITKE